MMLDALRERSKRTIAGQRAAFIDEEKQQFAATFRKYHHLGATDQEAAEAGSLTVQNDLRDRQARVGNSLVDSRSGAGDIAAIAGWAGMAVPAWDDLKDAIETQTERMTAQHEQSQEARTRKDFTES